MVSNWNGALANMGEKITGGRPPIASKPPGTVPDISEDLSIARLKRGATRPSSYMLVKTGLYGILVAVSKAGLVPAYWLVIAGKAKPIRPLDTPSPNHAAKSTTATCWFLTVIPAIVTGSIPKIPVKNSPSPYVMLKLTSEICLNGGSMVYVDANKQSLSGSSAPVVTLTHWKPFPASQVSLLPLNLR